MQRVKTLTKFLKELAELVAAEAESNAAFAEKLDAIMAGLPKKSKAGKKKLNPADIPDVYKEWQRLGETEFPFWLAGLDLETLKAIVKINGFDLTKATKRWTEPDKFVLLITEQLKSRLKRGSSFITAKQGEKAGGGGVMPSQSGIITS